MAELMNHEAAYRTAPATPGLLKSQRFKDGSRSVKVRGPKMERDFRVLPPPPLYSYYHFTLVTLFPRLDKVHTYGEYWLAGNHRLLLFKHMYAHIANIYKQLSRYCQYLKHVSRNCHFYKNVSRYCPYLHT